METIKELLGSHPFFAGLSPSAVELIAGCASNVHFAEGDRIFDEGDPASLFYVIRHGRVALEAHSPAKGPLVIDTMEEGEVLGWSWLVAPYCYFFDARAVTPVSATAVDGGLPARQVRGRCGAGLSVAEAGHVGDVGPFAVLAHPAARPVRVRIRAKGAKTARLAPPGLERRGQGGDHGTVSPVRPRAGDPPLQHRDLMPQHGDLRVLSGITPRQEHQQASPGSLPTR